MMNGYGMMSGGMWGIGLLWLLLLVVLVLGTAASSNIFAIE
jgi:hypothetical protein